MTAAAPEPVLAREFNLELNTGTIALPVWTKINGITGINPGQTSTKTDDTDFDTDGWESGTVVQRGRTLSVAINYKESPDDGHQDPGQEALIALGDAMGPSAKGQFRYTSPGGDQKTFRATTDIQWPGGDKTANANFTAELTVDGPPVNTPVASAPTINSVTPDTGAAAGGANVEIKGLRFSGATGVTFGGVAATGVVVVDASTIVCTIPAHAAGVVDVAVTTPAGTGTKTNAFTYA